jgi:hypothetical protein
MDAGSYLSSGAGIRSAIEDQPVGWLRLGRLAKVWTPPRIKTVLVSPEFGAPYFNTSQVFDIRPTPRKWLSVEKTVKAETRFAKQGTILVLASASVGRSALTTVAHEGAVISHHFMRLDPVDPAFRGWIYAFLKSPQARAMMSGVQYASVIRHIEPSHMGALPVPIVTEAIAVEFVRRTQAILDLRNRAHGLALASEERFAASVGPVEYDGKETGFELRASALFGGRRRLEATFHAPAPAAIMRRFKAIGAQVVPLSQVSDRVWWMPRFRRFYGDGGIPYLSADELFTTNPAESKRILVEAGDGHEDFFVKRGWIVMACSGQTYGLNGAACLTSEYHENTFFSHDLIRIIPKSSEIRPGYLVTALTHPTLGRPLLIRAAYGTSIPHLDPGDVSAFSVVRLPESEEAAIADLAEEAAAERSQADVLERELTAAADDLMDRFLAGDMASFVPIRSMELLPRR